MVKLYCRTDHFYIFDVGNIIDMRIIFTTKKKKYISLYMRKNRSRAGYVKLIETN